MTNPLDAWMAALTPESLRAKGSMKWTTVEPGEIGAFIAELDTPMATCIRVALADALDSAHTGYLGPALSSGVSSACAQFQHRRYAWDVDPAHIVVVPDVLGALQLTIRELVDETTTIVVPTPAYMPFLDPVVTGQNLVTVPMSLVDGRWRMDPTELQLALTGGGLLVLVNPHNPTGQVATAAELAEIADIVERTRSTVFVDEIHAPLVYEGAVHVPYASLSPATAQHSVTAVSASKGWNLPGLPCAQLILTSERHRGTASWWTPIQLHGATPLGAIATTAAYTDGIEHLDAIVEYLDRGRALFAAGLAHALPLVPHHPPEATYLQWLDLRPMGIEPAAVRERTGVWGTPGQECGTAGFLRLSLGTPHHIIEDVLARLALLEYQT